MSKDDYVLPVNEVHIKDNTKVSFIDRTAALTVQVGKLLGTKSAQLYIIKQVLFYLGTRLISPPVTSLKLKVTTYVLEGGSLDLPDTVYVENGVVLDLCGGIKSVKNLVSRNNGEIKGAYPAFSGTNGPGVMTLETLVWDYNGKISGTTCTGQTKKDITLTVTSAYKKVSGASIPTTYWKITGTQENLSPSASALTERTCNSTVSDLLVANGQTCALEATTHTYSSITIETGGKITLDGDETGAAKTVINVDSLHIRPGGKLDGAGTGYKTGGPGSGTVSGQAGSYGGLGGGVTDASKLYGNVENPNHYGSNGFGATSTSGRGGGYVKIVATQYVQIGE